MSNGFGPLMTELDQIIYDGREYWLGSAWSSWENWVEIYEFEDDGRGDNKPRSEAISVLTLPSSVAVKVAAAILLAETGADDESYREKLTDSCREELTKLLDGIILDEDGQRATAYRALHAGGGQL